MIFKNHGCDRGILVCDYGSQYTLIILRKLRELGVYGEVIDGGSHQPPEGFQIDGVILSGGPDSLEDLESRTLPQWLSQLTCPILGICYGMQLLVDDAGGSVRQGEVREYGQSKISLLPAGKQSPLFEGVNPKHTVWMSHGDDAGELPETFDLLARSQDGAVAAVGSQIKPHFGLQYHPEVHHSEFGEKLLTNFVKNICKISLNWQAPSMVAACQELIREQVGEGKVLCATSGGVDSTVAAVLLCQTLGADRVHCVLTDNGVMRHNEVEWVREQFESLGLNFEVLDEKERFFNALAGKTDPEEKRRAVGKAFVESFQEHAMKLDGFTHLGQGTLYPDVIESAGHGAGAKVIKSHHNVGGLPETLKLNLVEPFRYLFKDEVRKIGRELKIPDQMLDRHPFPGPGLSIRIPGEVTRDKVAVLQKADHIFIEQLRSHGYYEKVWQAGTMLLPVKSVGVMGDNRTYQNVCVLRAVCASDGMTAQVSELDHHFLTKVADQIVRNVDGINRVLYDVTSKPPATIEWE